MPSRRGARAVCARGRGYTVRPHCAMATLGNGGPLTSGPHDVGGLCNSALGAEPEADFNANSSRSFQQWEREVQAMISIVRQQDWTDGEPVLPSWDPVRRAIESLPKPVCE